MANYRAISNSNWSSLATWEDDSLGYFAASSVLPSTNDDVYSNNFTVNVNQNITVNSLRNTSFTAPTQLGAMSIPQMTSNTLPSGTAFASSAGSIAWNAFDRNTGTSWQSSGVASSIGYQFTTGKIIKKYAFLTATSNLPSSWTFQGSNDGVSYTTIDTKTSVVLTASTWFIYDVSANTTSYTYYRINVSAPATSAFAEIEMSEVTNLYGSITVGGSFNFNTAGVVASVTSSTSSLSQGATNLIQVTATTGTVTLNISSNATGIAGLINYTGNCNFALSGFNFTGSISNTTAIISKSSAGTMTANGNFIGGGFSVSTTCISNTLGDIIINGNVFGGIGGVAISLAAGNATINGNVFGGATNGISNSGSGSITLNGIATARTTAAISTSVANTINVIGDVYASGTANGISSTNASGIVNLTGNMYNGLGRQAIYCQNIFISNTATTLWRMDTGGGNYKFLYSADTTPNLPSVTNVRSGTTFGPALSLTGTMVVASAANTRKDVPTDNTVGTGELTSADIISGINASSDSLAVRMKNILTDVTAGNIISQYNNS